MEKRGKQVTMHFFSGTTHAKIDDKGRFVLPQHIRHGLVEAGELRFSIGLGLGGCLTIYKRSDIEGIVDRFKKKQHIAKYQPFFTTFFSTLHQTTCDKIGRTSIPQFLKDSVGIEKEIVIAGVLNKVEIWSKEAYDKNLQMLIQGDGLGKMTEEAFALLGEEQEAPLKKVTADDLANVFN